MTDFQLPKDGAIYTEKIFNRCRSLISYNIWGGLEQHRLDAWISNFRTSTEKYFAAKVLDALIYRSDSQTVALMQQLFQRTIPDLERQKKISTSLTKIYTSLKKRNRTRHSHCASHPSKRTTNQKWACLSKNFTAKVKFPFRLVCETRGCSFYHS